MTAERIYERPAELLQNLIRFDTTNPPGNEDECIRYIAALIADAGLDPLILAKTPARSNVIARLKGDGRAAPLLLYGHVDVVTTENQKWRLPPFAAEIADGFIWGRGALDMKSGVAMLLAAFLRAKARGASLPGDVIFCAVADEEAGGHFGARFLVEEHAGLFSGVRYALGEFGGFNMRVAGKRIYPVMVAEKQLCGMRLTFRGRGGHASMPVRGGAAAKAARALSILDRRELPYHLTPPVRLMLEGIARAVGGLPGLVLGQAANPLLSNIVLRMVGPASEGIRPLLRNTASPTMLSASSKINVIPSEVSIGVDGRILPGMTPDDMRREVRALLGEDFDLEVIDHDPGPTAVDMGMFDALGGILSGLDPTGAPVPLVLAGVTDARFFARLGIQTYGFTPLSLPDDFNFNRTIHAADERLPLGAVEFGAQAVFQALQLPRG